MSEDCNDKNGELQKNRNECFSSEGLVEIPDSSDLNALADSFVDSGGRIEIDTFDDYADVKKEDDENIEFVDKVLPPQPEGNPDEDVHYSHPDIVVRKETTIYSYHDSDSDLADYDLAFGALHPCTNLDKSDADSWDWTFHDENISDFDVKMTPASRKKSSLLTNISENFSTEIRKEAPDLKSSKHPLDNEYQLKNIHTAKERNGKNNSAANYAQTLPRKHKSEKACRLHAPKCKNAAVTFISRENTCNEYSEKRNKAGHILNKFEDDVVYFEDLRSSQLFKTRLKYLGNNCSVGSKISSSKENHKPRIDKINKRKVHEEFLLQAAKTGKERNVYRKFAKLEEMFIYSCRNNETMKVNLFVDKNELSSPLSLSLSKSEFFLPSVDSRVDSIIGQRQSLVGHLPEKLTSWKLNKARAISKSNMFVKSVSKEDAEKLPGNLQSPRQHQSWTGLGRFQHVARMVLILLRAVGLKPKKEESSYNFLSWTVVYDEVLGISRQNNNNNSALIFDPLMYKANKESTLSQETKDILKLPSCQRTETHVHAVMVNLHNVIQSFSEFPKRIQQSMIKVCTYEKFEAGRVMIRQGHRAENFYFIISGSAIVTKMDSKENQVHTISILGKGNSFGELAFLNMSKRAATVTCRENVELLCIERDDFIDIFMCPHKGQEPDHIIFLKSIDLLKGWPVQMLPHANPKICAFTYVRRDVILCQNSMDSDWIIVIYSGTCKVLTSLDDGPIRRREERSKLPEVRNDLPHDDLQTHNNDILYKHHVLPSIDQDDKILQDKTDGSAPKKVTFQKLLPPTHTIIKGKRTPPGLVSSTIPLRVLPQSGTQSQQEEQPVRKTAFIEIARLEAGDVFGLEHVVLSGMRAVASCSLVSEGAEVVLISRSFFRKHLTEDTVKRMRLMIRPLPSEKSLQKKYETKKLWDVYKSHTLAKHTNGSRRLTAKLQAS